MTDGWHKDGASSDCLQYHASAERRVWRAHGTQDGQLKVYLLLRRRGFSSRRWSLLLPKLVLLTCRYPGLNSAGAISAKDLSSSDFFRLEDVGTHPTGLFVTGIFDNARRNHMKSSAVRDATPEEIAWHDNSGL